MKNTYFILRRSRLPQPEKTWLADLLSLTKNRLSKSLYVCLAALLLSGIQAKAQFVSVPVTGYTADVVADGATGAATGSTTADVDGAGWVFLSPTFNPGSGICVATSPSALPASNQVSSLTTSGLIYDLPSYSGNNCLRLPFATSGTLTLTTPVQAANIYLLALGGSGACTMSVTVTFTDLTTQVITGNVADWCSGTSPASPQYFRIQRAAVICTGGAACQYFYDVNLPLSISNYGKSVASITILNTTVGTGPILNVMGVGMKTPCAVPTAQPSAILSTGSTIGSITGSFTAASPAPSHYLVVRYPAGTATLTPPVDGTTYVTGNVLGTGTIVAANTNATTTFTASGLNGGTSYDFYGYAYNSANNCGGPIYLKTSPATATLSTSLCGTTIGGSIAVGPGLPNTPAGGYTSLTLALADINTNGLNANTTLELQTGYDGTSANETFPLTFNFNGCINAGRTLTIRPAASVSSPLTITSSNATATFDINGSQYLIVDGRPGGTGTTSQLQIINTSTGGVAIKFSNDAQNNTFTYCDVQGQNTVTTASATPSGVIYFGAANSNLLGGNDNNIISYCNIHATSGGNPAIGICSFGTATSTSSPNSSNVITNCNIYDYLNLGGVDVGILLSTGSTDWTITNNSIYQAATRTQTAAATDIGISIANTSGNNFIITGNYIGGTAASAGGTPWTIAGAFANRFRAISISAGTTTASTISGNTIANFSYTSNSSATTVGGAWTGIYLAAGAANITGNTIGSGTGNGSVTINMLSNSGGRSSGIYSDASSGTSTITGNIIGSVTTSGAVAAGFSGIVNTAAATLTINANTIGSTSTVNSINANTTYTGTTAQVMYGIHNTGASTIAITNNTIANLNNAYLPAAANTGNMMTGILSTSGLDSIVGNSIYNFTLGANSTGTGTGSGIVGIVLTSTTATTPHTVSQNTIYSLSNTHATAASSVQGIYISGATTGNNIAARNFIYNLAVSSSSTSANVFGITANAGLFTYQNNMIRLGLTADGSASITNPINIIGLNEVSGTAGSGYYFNSIYIGGTNVTTGATNTFAFKSATTNTRTIQNNIFVNERSNNTSTGKHYAITVAGTTANPTGLSCDYNDLFVNGTGGILGLFNALDQLTLSTWQTAVGQGFGSMNQAPGFAGANAATADLHITGATPIESAGLPVASITNDFDGGVRASLTPTDIGADAGTFTANDVSAPVISNPTVLASTCLLTNQTVTATITDASGVPAALSGTEPRIYYKRVSPNTTAYFSAAGTLTSGSVTNGVWSFTIDYSVLGGGIATGDSINYYITAQDVGSFITANPSAGFAATNVNTITTHPTTQFAYNINYTMAGTYNVGSTGTFPTLTAAIKAYNTACLTGPVKFLLTDNNYSTSESFPITILKNPNASTTNTLTILPTQTSTVINSTAGVQTLALWGAKYVTIDGRIGAIGSTPNLTIQNGLSTGVALYFLNDAQNDTINYCNILATNGSAASGIIVFGTTNLTTTTSGNSYNVISNSTIDGEAGATASPTVSSSANAIYSAGTTTYTNKYNIIHNNNILDYFQAAVASNGILISTNTSDWTISSNKFYQTNPRTQTTAAAHTAINIVSAGTSFQIRNNVIGYSTNNGLGTYTLTGTVATTFKGMLLTLGTGAASTIQGNTIDGISLTTTASGATTSSPFMGIYVTVGLVNIGDTIANTFGNQSATGTLVYSSNSASLSDVFGIYYNGGSALNISNNTFGGITAGNTNATPSACNIYAVRTSTSTAALTFLNNTIGGTVANSIQSTTPNAASVVDGIVNTAMAATITGNTIRNLSSVDGTGTGTASAVSGIVSSSTANSTILNNVISNLSSAGTSANVAGITITAGGTVNVTGNTINTLSGSGATTTVVRGINVSGGTTLNISKNKIYDLSQSGAVTTSPSVNGMTFSAGTTVNAYNNLIGDLRAPAAVSTDAIRGIAVTSTTATTTYRIYYNSIYLNASSSGTDFGTSGIYHTVNATATTASLDLRNNTIIDLSTPAGTGIIASFRRSGTALNNYATTSNRNQFYAGTAGAANLIMYDGTNSYQTIAAYQTALTNRDLNSFTGEGGFTYSVPGSFFQSITGSSAQFLSPVAGITTQCEGGAVAITTPAITDDYAGNLRSVTTPDVGAWEFVGITPTPALVLNSVTPPATPQCTATDRVISIDVTTPIGSITSVTLNYTFNNVAQTPVTMTNSIGNTWTGTIVAPTTPTNSTVAWSASAISSLGVSGTLTGPATYADVPLTGVTGTAIATFTTVCSGNPTDLSVSLSSTTPTAFSWSDGSTVVGTTNPLTVSPTSTATYTCTVTSLGCTLVSSGVAITVNAVPTTPTASGSTQCGVAIPSASVTSTSGASGPAFNWYTAATGGTLLQSNPYTALMPFYNNDFTSATLTNASINGSAAIASGVLTLQPNAVSLAGGYTINSSGYNSDQYQVDFDMTTVGPATMADGFSYNFGDDVSATAIVPVAEQGTGSKLKIGFFTYNAINTGNGRGIYLMYNLPAGGTYTAATTGVLAYSTNTAFINSTQHITVTINTAGQLTMTLGATTIFSNVQLPASFLTADKSTWSHVIKSRSGGVAGGFSLDNMVIQASQPAAGSTTYLSPVSTTTTFYVSEFSGGCPSARVPVTVTVTTPDPLVASASAVSNVCVNTPVSLSVSQTGSANTYVLSWTADPVTGSGIPTSTAGSLVTPASVTPTAGGTYTYMVTGVESGTGCTATDTVNVSVLDPFAGVTITSGATPNPVCLGSAATLNVVFGSTIAAPTYTLPPAVTNPTVDEDLGNITITRTATSTVILNNTTANGSLAGTIGTGTGTAGSYSNFTSFGPYNLIPGQTYDFSVTSLQPGNPYFNAFGIWIDYNHNGSFSDAGETVYTSAATTSGGHTETGSFIVPLSAVTGNTRMRVLSIEGTPSSPTVTPGYGEYEEYTMNIIPNVSAYSWSDGSTTVGTTNPLSLAPTTGATYTPTITVSGCSTTGTPIVVTVNPLPSAPTATASAHCGNQVPTASVSSTTGAGSPVFNWYAAAAGGTPLQSGASATYTSIVAATTTFYVSETFNSCESARTPVTVTVTIPDALNASTTPASNACANATLALSVSKTGTANTYSYVWTASPGTGSGITGSASGGLGSPTNVTPTVAGTYTYTITGTEAGTGCITSDTSIISVIDPFNGVTVTAGASLTPVCSGTPTSLSVVLTGGNPTLSAFSWSDGSTVVGTTNPLSVSPTTPATYTCTVTSSGCTAVSSSTSVGITPLPSAPNATGSIQCGLAVPGAVVTSTSGAATPSFNWYSASTGGTLLQSAPFTALMPYYNNDFTSATLTNSSITGAAAIASGILTLHPLLTSQTGGFTVNASGYNSDKYKVEFDMTSGSSASIADGISYNFGDDVSASTTTPSAERGTGSRLRIGFFTYNAASGSDGKGIYLMYAVPAATTTGYTAATTGVLAYSTNVSFINATQHVIVDISPAGQLTLTVGGTVIFNSIQLPSDFTSSDKSTWAHVIKSRSGGVSGTFSIDNVDIQASQQAAGSTTYLSPISTSTTFYVSEFSGGCLSTRTPVTATVTTPNLITAASSATSNVCVNTPISLSVTQTGSVNTYAFTWTASPATGSGIATSASGAIGTPTVITPTAAGTYTYTITGTESGTGCATASTVTVTVIDPFNGVTVTSGASANPVCSGSPTSLSVSLTGGSPAISAYSWSDGSTAVGTTNPLTVSPVANTTYSCTVTSAGCVATSSSVTVTVNPLPTSPATTNSTQCGTGIPTASVASTTGAGSPVFNWYVAPSGGSLLQSSTSTTYTSSISTTTTFYVSELGSGCLSPRTAVVATVAPSIGGSVTGAATVCAGNTSGVLTLSGNTGSITGWESSVSPFTSWTPIANTTTTYTSGVLTQETHFRAVVVNGSCPSANSSSANVVVNNTNNWSGTTSTAWATTTNWGCGRVPLVTDDVVIVAGGNQPVIIDAGRTSNNLSIGTGATLTLNNTASHLTIAGAFTNSGTITHTAGEIELAGSSAQSIPAGAFNRINVNNAAGVSLAGNITINESVVLNNGTVTLGANTLTLAGSTSTINNASSSRFIVTNGAGSLNIQSIGATGRTGAVSFPVGSGAASYTPVAISNTGASDEFSARVSNNVFNTYTGSTGSGAAITTGAVDRTWIINETTPGGSTASVTLQWNGTDELSGFTRGTSYAAHYLGGVNGWAHSSASAATGSNPYTQAYTGLADASAPFSVGSGSTLPVKLLSFAGINNSGDVNLNWTTANEVNNIGFDVERSVDGKTFTKVGFVKGSGTTSAVRNYALTDAGAFDKVHAAVLYYRLKQLDYDNRYSYSNIISVSNADMNKGAVAASPNPFVTDLNLSVTAANNGTALMIITDVQGREIATRNLTFDKGLNTYKVTELNNAYNGIYFVKVIMNGETSIVKITKVD
jgi:hypothetical protein